MLKIVTIQFYPLLQWRAADAQIEVQNTELKVFLSKPGVGRYIATHAMLTARDFFLANFYPSGPFTCIFSQTSPQFVLCLLWLTLIPVLTRRIK